MHAIALLGYKVVQADSLLNLDGFYISVEYFCCCFRLLLSIVVMKILKFRIEAVSEIQRKIP